MNWEEPGPFAGGGVHANRVCVVNWSVWRGHRMIWALFGLPNPNVQEWGTWCSKSTLLAFTFWLTRGAKQDEPDRAGSSPAAAIQKCLNTHGSDLVLFQQKKSHLAQILGGKKTTGEQKNVTDPNYINDWINTKRKDSHLWRWILYRE